MGFLSFGSKKDKMKKLIEEERFDEAVGMAVKDKKAMAGLIELLNEGNPGLVGDALLILTNVIREKPEAFKPYVSAETFKKLVSLMEMRNPYVRENAMMLAYETVRRFPELISENRDWIVQVIRRGLHEGDKNQKGFLLLVIGELGLTELRDDVMELTNVEDKVILPFEGYKWVPLGQIAREVLEKL